MPENVSLLKKLTRDVEMSTMPESRLTEKLPWLDTNNAWLTKKLLEMLPSSVPRTPELTGTLRSPSVEPLMKRDVRPRNRLLSNREKSTNSLPTPVLKLLLPVSLLTVRKPKLKELSGRPNMKSADKIKSPALRLIELPPRSTEPELSLMLRPAERNLTTELSLTEKLLVTPPLKDARNTKQPLLPTEPTKKLVSLRMTKDAPSTEN